MASGFALTLNILDAANRVARPEMKPDLVMRPGLGLSARVVCAGFSSNRRAGRWRRGAVSAR